MSTCCNACCSMKKTCCNACNHITNIFSQNTGVHVLYYIYISVSKWYHSFSILQTMKSQFWNCSYKIYFLKNSFWSPLDLCLSRNVSYFILTRKRQPHAWNSEMPWCIYSMGLYKIGSILVVVYYWFKPITQTQLTLSGHVCNC